MTIIKDKTVLIFFSFILCLYSADFYGSVAVLLVTVIISELAWWFSGKKYCPLILAAAPLFSFFYPEMILGMPLIAYGLNRQKKLFLLIPYASFLLKPVWPETEKILLLIFGVLAAVLLSSHSMETEKFTKLYHETRDMETEKNMKLSEKNRELLLKQDYEIHLATLKERNRIAREIHDNVGHMLTRSLLQVGALCVINKDENQKPMLESLKDTLDSAMTNIRNSVHNLHDDSIDLKAAVSESIKSAEGKFSVSLDYDISANVRREIKLCIIGVVKESISNIIKHSEGDRISVIIREHPAFWQVTVSDNGKCTDTGGKGGIGLSNMRDRAESVGGLINFTASEKGYRVFMTIPKKEDER
ncbi:MAG: histidine kinase [Oscillospiraceae bacterium]|nr:histidine kinase [Oscillospiraceae bacterium]MDD6084098.1 histidine kinase [Oscillospiraceae bacterium]